MQQPCRQLYAVVCFYGWPKQVWHISPATTWFSRICRSRCWVAPSWRVLICLFCLGSPFYNYVSACQQATPTNVYELGTGAAEVFSPKTGRGELMTQNSNTHTHTHRHTHRHTHTHTRRHTDTHTWSTMRQKSILQADSSVNSWNISHIQNMCHA